MHDGDVLRCTVYTQNTDTRRQTHGDRHTDTDTDTPTQTHRHRHTQRHTQRHTHTMANKGTHTQRHRHTDAGFVRLATRAERWGMIILVGRGQPAGTAHTSQRGEHRSTEKSQRIHGTHDARTVTWSCRFSRFSPVAHTARLMWTTNTVGSSWRYVRNTARCLLLHLVQK